MHTEKVLYLLWNYDKWVKKAKTYENINFGREWKIVISSQCDGPFDSRNGMEQSSMRRYQDGTWNQLERANTTLSFCSDDSFLENKREVDKNLFIV